MAFGNLASQMILFIAVVSLATGFVAVMKGQVEATAGSLSTQQQRLSNALKTEMTIEVINHDSGNDQTYVYAKNTGESKIDISKIDVFTNNLRIARNDGNRTIEVLPDTDTKNIGTWDPGEEILIMINQTLASSQTHKITIANADGITDQEEFSI